MRSRFACILFSMLMGLFPVVASAELTAYEGFDYAAGSATGLDGGMGFAGPWRQGGFSASVSSNFDVVSDSLDFQNLETIGNRLSASSTSSISGITRDLAVPLGDPGTVSYVSFLLRPEGVLNQGQFNGFFGVTLQTGSTEAFVGKPGGGSLDEYVLENRGGSEQVSTNAPTIVNEPTLLVLRAEHGNFNTSLDLFVDPVPGLLTPTFPLASRQIVNEPIFGLTAYSTGAYSLDEIRVGTTFADVVPIPEPSSELVMAVAVLGLFIRCRKRRRA